jgi:hypothetical protein
MVWAAKDGAARKFEVDVFEWAQGYEGDGVSFFIDFYTSAGSIISGYL